MNESIAAAETVPAAFLVVFLIIWDFAMLAPLFGCLRSLVTHDRKQGDTLASPKSHD